MRVWQVLAIWGAAGLLSLLALPVEAIVPETTLPPMLLRLVATIQPALLTILAITVGTALAPKVGLSAPLAQAIAERGEVRTVLARQAGPALAVALAVAAILLAYGRFTQPYFEQSGDLARKLAAFSPPLVTRLLYGGIVEELLTRWGLVSLFAWGLWRLRGRPTAMGAGSYWLAIALAALLFAAGHLPVLFMAAPSPPTWLIGAVLAGNAGPGLLFGWLYWRRGLEAAMLAHAGAHLIAWAVG